MHQVRLFVLWIVMFAVPFQGYAAAAMVFCGPGHAGSTAAVAVKVPGHAQHPHADGHGDPSYEGAQEAKPPAKADDAMHKCSICSACHATALTTTLAWALFHDLPQADLAEPVIPMATLPPRVLDKPPRA